MKQILNVEIKNYEIIISDDNIKNLIEELLVYTDTQKKLFVISQKVFNLYNEYFLLTENEYIIIKDGEAEKNIQNYLKILKKAKDIGLNRDDVIIAIGGGVIGDITGFVASTYMRGIDFIQVPTTLLSMVDSSVGGKTAINLFGIKNIIGTFYQPKRVYININFLKTLDKRQFLSGIGEILKYAFIEDNCGFKHSLFFFEYLTLCCEKLLELEAMTVMRVIEYALNLKISVINQDEKETNLRKILNFGHTYGHAIETLGNYKKFLHGEAIVQGIFFIFNYAYSKNMITYSYYRLAMDLLSKYGFKYSKPKCKSSKLLDIMKKDKKVQNEKITFIVPCEKRKVKYIQLEDSEILDLIQN